MRSPADFRDRKIGTSALDASAYEGAKLRDVGAGEEATARVVGATDDESDGERGEKRAHGYLSWRTGRLPTLDEGDGRGELDDRHPARLRQPEEVRTSVASKPLEAEAEHCVAREEPGERAPVDGAADEPEADGGDRQEQERFERRNREQPNADEMTGEPVVRGFVAVADPDRGGATIAATREEAAHAAEGEEHRETHADRVEVREDRLPEEAQRPGRDQFREPDVFEEDELLSASERAASVGPDEEGPAAGGGNRREDEKRPTADEAGDEGNDERGVVAGDTQAPKGGARAGAPEESRARQRVEEAVERRERSVVTHEDGATRGRGEVTRGANEARLETGPRRGNGWRASSRLTVDGRERLDPRRLRDGDRAS